MIVDLLHGVIDHNAVFSALIGIESMYTLTRVHQNGSVRLWFLLLPLLAFSALSGLLLFRGSSLCGCGYLMPLLMTVIAASGAALITRLHTRLNRRAHEQEAAFLFFASMTALMLLAAWQDTESATIASSLRRSLETWAGYGIGLACFASIGVRLHPFAAASRLGGIALFYLTLALAGLALGGVMGIAGR